MYWGKLGVRWGKLQYNRLVYKPPPCPVEGSGGASMAWLY